MPLGSFDHLVNNKSLGGGGMGFRLAFWNDVEESQYSVLHYIWYITK